MQCFDEGTGTQRLRGKPQQSCPEVLQAVRNTCDSMIIDDNPPSQKHNGWHCCDLQPQGPRSRAFYYSRNILLHTWITYYTELPVKYLLHPTTSKISITHHHQIRHLGSLTAANWVSFDFNVAYSSRWGYSLIKTLKLKKILLQETTWSGIQYL